MGYTRVASGFDKAQGCSPEWFIKTEATSVYPINQWFIKTEATSVYPINHERSHRISVLYHSNSPMV